MPLPSTAWQPGQSGNPQGGKLTSILRMRINAPAFDDDGNEILEEDASGKRKQVKKLQLVADALIRRAIKGEIAAIQECFNRLDGRVPTDLTVTRRDDLPATTFEELAQGVAEALLKLRGESQQVIENNGQSPDTEPTE